MADLPRVEFHMDDDEPEYPKNDAVYSPGDNIPDTGDDPMNEPGTIFGREPAMVLALVQAVIVLAVTFGLRLTPEQTGAILTLSAVVLGLITRSRVTPS